jgi:citrate lyase subunit beta/citryl-CoA lyase
MTDSCRRSVLYIPATNQRALDKARSLACDAIILDLEDSVQPHLKESARDRAVATLERGGFIAREIVVRVNALDTPWGATDLSVMAGTCADGILVPKVNGRHDIDRYQEHLVSARPALRLWAMLETARCIFHLDAIAAARESTRLSALVIGTNDLIKEMMLCSRTPVLSILAFAVAAARSYRVDILDGVYNNFRDESGFAAECRQGVEFGFDGKTLIHPTQIEICNQIFAPGTEAVAAAQGIVEAFDRPENRDKAVIQLDGQMVERLHLVQAHRTLMRAGLSSNASALSGKGAE